MSHYDLILQDEAAHPLQGKGRAPSEGQRGSHSDQRQGDSLNHSCRVTLGAYS